MRRVVMLALAIARVVPIQAQVAGAPQSRSAESQLLMDDMRARIEAFRVVQAAKYSFEPTDDSDHLVGGLALHLDSFIRSRDSVRIVGQVVNPLSTAVVLVSLVVWSDTLAGCPPRGTATYSACAAKATLVSHGIERYPPFVLLGPGESRGFAFTMKAPGDSSMYQWYASPHFRLVIKK